MRGHLRKVVKKNKVGMRDVSNKAGVAISTVSHVLNGTAPISEDVRKRVLAVARETGYLAQRTAKASIGSIESIALLLPEDSAEKVRTNPMFARNLDTLLKECKQRGIRVVKQPISPVISNDELTRTVRSTAADGVIILKDVNRPLSEAVQASGLPSVIFNGEDPDVEVDVVAVRYRNSARYAASHLISLGHEKIIFISATGFRSFHQRREGYQAAFEEANLPAENAIVLSATDCSVKSGKLVINDWMAAHDDLEGVTAVFCATDSLAIGALDALQSAGLKVPEDVSVMGFDGLGMQGNAQAPVTTMSLPFAQMADAAICLLEKRAQTVETAWAPARVELSCLMVDGNSVAPQTARYA